MEIGIKSRDVVRAEEEFLLKFPDSDWFLKIIKVVKEYQEKGIQVTDVLIKENSIPFFGILKNFFPLLLPIKPTGDQIRNFVVNFLKAESLDVSVIKKRSSIDFSLLFYGKGNLRINYSQDANGVALNIRILDFIIPEIDTVRYPERYKKFLKSLIFTSKLKLDRDKEVEVGAIKEGGLILHAGPTGSGKTTCVASEVNFFLQNTTGLIITYENPIEYRFLDEARIRQVELDVHLNRNDVYRHFLRNSPMVGMIGEIKTKEEFIQALDLASRGHLVITTIHANNVLEAIYMFLSLVGKEYTSVFLSSVRAIMCHRLFLNKKSKLVPLYEYLIPNHIIKKTIEDWKFKDLENYLYGDKQAPKGSFYSFPDCIEERASEGLLSISEKERLKGGLY